MKKTSSRNSQLGSQQPKQFKTGPKPKRERVVLVGEGLGVLNGVMNTALNGSSGRLSSTSTATATTSTVRGLGFGDHHVFSNSTRISGGHATGRQQPNQNQNQTPSSVPPPPPSSSSLPPPPTLPPTLPLPPPPPVSASASASTKTMSVQLNPSSSLGFRRPLTALVKRSLTITNNNPQPVAFKVKTTAPKLYCVRPNSGRVEPGESVDVSVMLQALKEEPPLNTKCKDKFLIQSTLITPDKETFSLADIWASPETNEEGKVFQQKLRVTYLPPEGQVLEEEEENAHVGMSSVMSVNDSQYDTVRQQPANGHLPLDSHIIGTAPSSQSQDPRPATPTHDTVEEPTAPLVAQPIPTIVEPTAEPPREPTPPPAPVPVPVSIPEPERIPEPTPAAPPAPEPVAAAPAHVAEPITPPATVPAPEPQTIYITKENPLNEELYAKYNRALEEIKGLQAQVHSLQQLALQAEQVQHQHQQEQQLRRRTRKLSDADSAAGSEAATMVEEAVPLPQEGVPLQVVVVIALGVFVTTYLFF